MMTGRLFDDVEVSTEGAVYLSSLVRLMRLCFQANLWQRSDGNSDRRPGKEIEKVFSKHCCEFYQRELVLSRGETAFVGADVVRAVRLTRVLAERMVELGTYVQSVLCSA